MRIEEVEEQKFKKEKKQNKKFFVLDFPPLEVSHSNNIKKQG